MSDKQDMSDITNDFKVQLGRMLDGTASDEQRAACIDQMRDSEEAMADYIAQSDMEAMLAWRSGQVVMPAVTEPSESNLRIHANQASYANQANQANQANHAPATGWLWQIRKFAAMIALMASIAGLIWWGNQSHQGQISIATTEGVQWSGGQKPYADGEIVDGVLRMDEGRVKLQLTNGGQLTLEGPAHFQIDQAQNMHLKRGRAILSTGGRKQALFINGTQVEHVVQDQDDLRPGQEALGIFVDEAGVSEVVVFAGRLKLSGKKNKDSAFNLSQGQGLRIDQGRMSRIVSIEKLPKGKWSASTTDRSSLIRSVRDNFESEMNKFYQIVPGGLVEDAPAYVDRDHQWNGVTEAGIPDFLIGADLLMPFNDDKNRPLRITLDLAPEVMLYVFWDDRVKVPEWLQSDYKNTGIQIGQDEGSIKRNKSTNKVASGAGKSIDNTFTIWQRPIELGGQVVLGGLQVDRGNVTVYGVAVKSF